MMSVVRQDVPLVHFFEVLRVSYSSDTSVTDHPVEAGADVSDHAQVRPLRFTVEAIATDSPQPLSLAKLGSEAALSFLEGAQGKPLTVVLDGEGSFAPCVLEHFTHDRTTALGRVFALSFKVIRIAQAISVTIPPRTPAPVAAAGAPTEVPLGMQATSPVPETSMLFELRALLSPAH